MTENSTYTEAQSTLRNLMTHPPLGSDLYEQDTHNYLLSLIDTNTFLPAFSINKDHNPYAKVFAKLEWEKTDERGEKVIIWPYHTWWYYSLRFSRHEDYPELHALLRFGYVVHGNKLMRSCFFKSEVGAVDPLAVNGTIHPTCYLGIPISKKAISGYVLNREFNTNPVELFHKEILVHA